LGGHVIDVLLKANELEEIRQGYGPGSQLWNLLEHLGIHHTPDCSCILLAQTMNSLGVEGCIYYRGRLIGLMRKNQSQYTWEQYLKVGVYSILTGWVFRINPFDPIPSLFDISISLAEEHGDEY